jgi:hypothetical protein
MHKEPEEPCHFWHMIGAFLSLKSDLDPLPVFDERGRPIGLGQLSYFPQLSPVESLQT